MSKDHPAKHLIEAGRLTFPTRPYKWGEDVKRTYTHEQLKARLEADVRGICPVCEGPATEQCEWCWKARDSRGRFEKEEREQ